MTKYETMFVLRTNLDEEARKAAQEAVLNVLTSNGANVLEVKEMGKRELAYEIEKERFGFYVVATFETEDSVAVEEFSRLANINKNVLRYIVVNLEA